MPDDAQRPHALTHAERLDRLAEVAVKVGLRLARGQELVLTARSTPCRWCARIAEHAYKAGAALVTVLYADEEDGWRASATHRDASFDQAAGWLYEGMAAAFRAGAARMAISARTRCCWRKDPAKVARANRANRSYRRR